MELPIKTLHELNEFVSKLDENPETGDDSNVEMYSMMLMSSTAGLAYMASKVKRKVIHR